jgi:UDP-N-acetylmuramate--alanine ligase
MAVDLRQLKKVYFIGIKGVAMSGLAVICKQRGLAVIGSDVAEEFITDKILAAAGITILSGFDPLHLDWQPDAVVVGTSWGDDNPEVAAAKKRHLPVITDSRLRGLLSQEKQTVAVTGVHGKTTTTALLAHLLNSAGRQPSYLIGTGTVPDLGGNAAWTAGQHFVVEGDEYIKSQTDRTAKFLDLKPAISIITSLEWEHVDVYKDEAAIVAAFRQLIEQTQELVVACGDWPTVERLSAGAAGKVVQYGLKHHNLWQAYDIAGTDEQTTFKVKKESVEVDQFTIKLFGEHNVSNALACIVTALKLGLDLEQIHAGLLSFSGAERRFEVVEHRGMIFVDDYGHHPSEIKATLTAIRQRYPDKQIWCVFQPHMASRTKALLNNFGASFSGADKVFVADIFTSAREKSDLIHSRDLVAAIGKEHHDVIYSGDLDQTTKMVQAALPPAVVLVTMGAGDVYHVRDHIIQSS